MIKQHTFRVDAPIETVWAVLGDDFDDIGRGAGLLGDRRALDPLRTQVELIAPSSAEGRDVFRRLGG